MKKNITYGNFGRELVKEVPELKDIYEEHLHYYKEELPHALLEDIFRYVEVNITNDIPDWMIRLIKFLEKAVVSTDGKVNNAVCVSFLDNLMHHLSKDNKKRLILRSHLTPHLKKELEDMDDWKPFTSFSLVKIQKMKKNEKKKLTDEGLIEAIREVVLPEDVVSLLETYGVNVRKKSYYTYEEKTELIRKLLERVPREVIRKELKLEWLL